MCGLSCAHSLGPSCIVLERERAPGGLARSFARSGFLFDCTGHWLHLRDAGVRELVFELVPDLISVERRAAIRKGGRARRHTQILDLREAVETLTYVTAIARAIVGFRRSG